MSKLIEITSKTLTETQRLIIEDEMSQFIQEHPSTLENIERIARLQQDAAFRLVTGLPNNRSCSSGPKTT